MVQGRRRQREGYGDGQHRPSTSGIVQRINLVVWVWVSAVCERVCACACVAACAAVCGVRVRAAVLAEAATGKGRAE